jgi:hypothetical protein
VVVILPKRCAITPGLGAATAVTGTRDIFVQLIISPVSMIEIGMAAVMPECVQGMHLAREVLVALLVQPAQVHVLLVA